jgi:hypothetical protein
MLGKAEGSRIQLVRDAVQYWNQIFTELGTPFRLGAVAFSAGALPVDLLRELSDTVVTRTAVEQLGCGSLIPLRCVTRTGSCASAMRISSLRDGPMAASVSTALPKGDDQRAQHDADVEPQRPVVDVIEVTGDALVQVPLGVDRPMIAVDLGLAGDPRFDVRMLLRPAQRSL